MRPEKAQAVNCMVRKLYTEAKSYYEPYPDRCANYEDLYYLAKQALDDELGEMENPAISFVKKLKTSILPLLEELLKDETNYTNILIDTCDYILRGKISSYHRQNKNNLRVHCAISVVRSNH